MASRSCWLPAPRVMRPARSRTVTPFTSRIWVSIFIERSLVQENKSSICTGSQQKFLQIKAPGREEFIPRMGWLEENFLKNLAAQSSRFLHVAFEQLPRWLRSLDADALEVHIVQLVILDKKALQLLDEVLVQVLDVVEVRVVV